MLCFYLKYQVRFVVLTWKNDYNKLGKGNNNFQINMNNNLTSVKKNHPCTYICNFYKHGKKYKSIFT